MAYQSKPQEVPIPGGFQPFQVPQNRGAADIILESAQLQRQDEQIKLKAQENLRDTITAFSELAIRQKNLRLDEEKAKAMLELQQAQIRKTNEETRGQRAINMALEGQPELIGQEGTSVSKSSIKVDGTKDRKLNRLDDPDRLLSPTEQEKYGVPAGTRFKDVEGQVPVAPAQRLKIQGFTNSIGVLDSLEQQIQGLGLADDIAGTITTGAMLTAKAVSPATAAGQFKRAAKNLSLLARSMGETGALAIEDVNRIQGLIPSFFDTKESAANKFRQIRSIMAKAKQNTKQGLSGDILSADDDGPALEDLEAEMLKRTSKKR